MRKILSVALVLSVLLTGCAADAASQTSVITENSLSTNDTGESISDETITVELSNKVVDPDNFDSISDPAALDYLDDCVYATLEEELASDDLQVVNVNAIYISQEYIDELEYNSQSNIYFGYTLDEIEAQLGDEPYIFTVGEDGSTVVQIAEAYDNSYNEIIRNVAVGTGVILVCVTVAVVSGGAIAIAGPGATAGMYLVNTIFVFAAEKSIEGALLGGAICGLSSGIITGCQTGDFQEALDAGLYAASEGYMWGAIFGAAEGGIEGFVSAPAWMKTSGGHPTWLDSEADIAKSLGAQEQVSFLGGEEVPFGTTGATRPDGVIYNADGTITAIEVKNYDLENNLYNLSTELQRQIGQRVVDLPAGSTQEIYLDIRGRGYTMEFLEGTVKPYLTEALSGVYPDIPIVFYGA